MRPTYFATIGVLMIGCVESAPDSMPARLVIGPANLSVTVVDGEPIAQPFTATLIDADGVHDVTAQTTFVLADSAFGAWSASTLEVSGDALGPTEVVAAHAGLATRTALTVYARIHRMLDAPSNAASLFERSVADASCAPSISYPDDGVVVPQNLGELDVQWADSRDDLFEVSFATTHLETRIYTRHATDHAGWTKLAGADWTRLAAQHEPIALRVSGVIETEPTLRCTAAVQHMLVADQPWSGQLMVSNRDGIYRIDAAHPSVAPAQLFSAAMWDALFAPIVGGTTLACSGCAFSRDGSRFAVSSETNGAIYDFTHDKLLAPGSHNWSYATFNLTGSKLVTSTAGDLRVITDDGTLLTTLASKPGDQALDPQVSPDGRWLANVAATPESFASTIVTRQFFDGSNEMGAATNVVPLVPGVASYYPSWSPDGKWLVFTRATGVGTVEVIASIWIVRADGTQPPIELTAPAKALDVRASFAPTLMTVDGEPMFYITFESRNAFGEQLAAGRMQLWAMPFYPERAAEQVGLCDVGGLACTRTLRAALPAFRLPRQSLATDNRVLQWLR